MRWKYLLAMLLLIVAALCTSPAKAAWTVGYDGAYNQWYVVQVDCEGVEVPPYYWYDSYPYYYGYLAPPCPSLHYRHRYQLHNERHVQHGRHPGHRQNHRPVYRGGHSGHGGHHGHR